MLWLPILAKTELTKVSEYMRDLIRRDMDRRDREAFERLKAELKLAFSAPESSYKPLTAAEVIERNQAAMKK